jgi:hypothetical protein
MHYTRARWPREAGEGGGESEEDRDEDAPVSLSEKLTSSLVVMLSSSSSSSSSDVPPSKFSCRLRTRCKSPLMSCRTDSISATVTLTTLSGTLVKEPEEGGEGLLPSDAGADTGEGTAEEATFRRVALE